MDPFSQDFCYPLAADVSCVAMKELALDEGKRNAAALQRNLVFPACERFQKLADREEEYVLQKPTTFSRKMCFTKTSHFQQGDWETAFPKNGVDVWNARFETWTRAKGSNKGM